MPEIVDNQAEFADWGNGWSIADEKRLAIRDVDADGTLGEFDARAASSVSLLYGGSTFSFLRQSDGSFENGSGDFRDLALSYASGEYTLATPDGSLTVFNASGLIQREEDSQGNQKLYDYFTSGEATTAGNADLAGHLEKVIMPDGTYVALGYNSSEEVTTLTDSYSRVTTLTRTSGKITAVTYEDPDGSGGSLLAPRIELDHNAAGQISAKRVFPAESNSSGDEETTFTYDTASGRLDEIGYPNGGTQEITPEASVGTNLGTIMSRATLVKSDTAYGFSTDDDGIVTRTKYNAPARRSRRCRTIFPARRTR